MKLFIVSVLLALQIVFAAGCMSGAVRHTVVTTDGQVLEHAANTKGKIISASEDRITVSNLCPEGYFVDVRKGSKLLLNALASNEVMTVRPSAETQDQPTVWSLTVYNMVDGKKNVMFSRDQIFRVGGRPLAASWVATKTRATFKMERYSGYYGGSRYGR